MILAQNETDGRGIPRIEVGEWIDRGFSWLNTNLGSFFNDARNAGNDLIGSIADVLMWPDALVTIAFFALIALVTGGWKLALLTIPMMLFIVSVEQWDNAMVTLALVLVATLIALVIGVPLGIASARSQTVSNIVRPVMDLLQTMPALVWLVPVVSLFRLGVTSAVIATLIFCLAPAVRFTELGIRQVDAEVVEAGHAFGGTRGQILRRIQLPLALPTIMAGVNQVIMLALSMAVIAGFVGGGGLGGQVTGAIGNLDIALGFEAGLSVVALAIFLDRVTAAVSKSKTGRSWRSRIRRAARSRNQTESKTETSAA